jgi:hypothetical protein
MSGAVPLLPLYTFETWKGTTLPLLLLALMYSIFKGIHLTLTLLEMSQKTVPASTKYRYKKADISVVLLAFIHN